MKILPRPLVRTTALLALLLVVLLAGCNRGRGRKGEPAYVAAPQVTLRDRLAQVYDKVGTAKNAERVEILDRDRKFARIRTESGLEGWVEQRNLVSEKVFQGFQALAQEHKTDPPQSTSIARNDTNLHLTPGRDTDHLYQMPQGSKVTILGRGTAEKRLPGATSKPAEDKPDAPKSLEDWWLVRDPQGHVGWVLARMVDVDVPLEVAQYAEGQRIVAAFPLNEVADGDQKVSQYLLLFSEPKDGMPFDYNQARVFTWNVKRHRYETAYRERLNGILPVTVGKETFDKEGELPTFTLNVKDKDGNVTSKKYKLNTPIVKRVDAVKK